MSVQTAAPDAAAQLTGLIFAVLLVDERSAIVQANPAAEELIGRSAQRLVGEPLCDAIGIADSRVAKSLHRADTKMIARNLSIATANKEHRVDLTSSPVHGHPGWRVVTLADAGQITAGDEGSERAALRAPAVLAHEIKNPLAAIRGASQLLARRVGAGDRPLTQMIAGEVDRIAHLIDRMQQLDSKPNRSAGPCNLHEAIRKAMATVRTGRKHRVALVEEFDPSLPAAAADQGALEQVLINLLANACDACAAVEDAQVTVRTRFAGGRIFNSAEHGKATPLPIEITVSDSGPGVDPALAGSVFEPFVTDKPHGQGLGLALVRKLLRDMGGRVAYERDTRAGLTHFRINLPVANEEIPA